MRRGILICQVVATMGCVSPRNEPLADAGATGDVGSSTTGGATTAPPGQRSDGSPSPDAMAPPPGLHRLTIQLVGPGLVVRPDDNLTCQGLCTLDLERGTSITLVARPAPSSTPDSVRFLSWSAPCGNQPTCEITLDADATLTATFHRFVLWEKPAPAGGSILTDGENLFLAGTFNGTLEVNGNRHISFGERDHFVVKLDAMGDVLWSRSFGGEAYEWLRWMDASSPGEFLVSGLIEGERARFAGTNIDPSRLGPMGHYFARFSSASGDLLDVSPTPSLERFDAGPDGSVVFVESAAAISRVRRRDRQGNDRWVSPALPESSGRYTDAVLTSDGDLLLSIYIRESVVLEGKTYAATGLGSSVLVKYGAAGDLLWALPVHQSGPGNLGRIFLDASGDIFLGINHVGQLAVGGRLLQSQLSDPDVAIARLGGGSGEVQWVKSWGSLLPDIGGPRVLPRPNGRLLICADFASRVTIEGVEYEKGTLFIELDAASGAVQAVDRFPHVGILIPRHSGDFFFTRTEGATFVGRFSFPP